MSKSFYSYLDQSIFKIINRMPEHPSFVHADKSKKRKWNKGNTGKIRLDGHITAVRAGYGCIISINICINFKDSHQSHLLTYPFPLRLLPLPKKYNPFNRLIQSRSMGNTELCKECQTFSQKTDNNPLSASSRTPFTVNISKAAHVPPVNSNIEALPNNRFRIRYETGEVYVGEMAGSAKHGQGRMEWPQGGFYEGAWENDKACGLGVFQQNQATYSGIFRNNELQKGKFVSPNGREIYEGEFRDHRFEGQGRLQKTGQYVYEGQFHNNLKNGHGKIRFQNGNEFEGEFLNGKFEGYGVFKSNTHTYEGDFRNGEYHGQGKYTWSSGSVYEGSYELGEKNGYGVYRNVDGSRYEGSWSRGKRHGRGVEVTAEGERLECEFENGIKKEPF